MAKETGVQVEGTVIEVLGNDKYRIELENGVVVIGHIAGKLKMNHIRIILLDKVTIELSPYDLTRGRVVYRHK